MNYMVLNGQHWLCWRITGGQSKFSVAANFFSSYMAFYFYFTGGSGQVRHKVGENSSFFQSLSAVGFAPDTRLPVHP